MEIGGSGRAGGIEGRRLLLFHGADLKLLTAVVFPRETAQRPSTAKLPGEDIYSSDSAAGAVCALC